MQTKYYSLLVDKKQITKDLHNRWGDQWNQIQNNISHLLTSITPIPWITKNHLISIII